ncbi:MAG: acyl-CoA dehydrogenase family protein [Alphaproteobacteria bacterium]
MEYLRETRGQNFYRLDVNLQRLLKRTAGDLLDQEEARLAAFGAWVGDEVDAQAEYTSRFAPPVLHTYDRDGETVNRVQYNPLYAAVHRDVYRHGIIGLNYGGDPRPFLLSFAMGYLLAQSDISIHCPVTLTGAVAYVLDRYAPKSARKKYLPSLIRMDGEAATGGTWVTELHGGSDVGATTTVARRTPQGYALSGLKWFVSNVDCDLAVATGRPEGAPEGSKGLGLYLVPRLLDDGTPNRLHVRRLKDKLGTRGLATGEVDLLDAHAVEIAPPPEGFKMMMAALEFSRIHNAVAAAGIQRRAFLEAVSYAAHREAFGGIIADYPMVQDGLVDLAVHLEASVALAFESARAFDAADGDDAEHSWLRTATALAKYHTAEQAIAAASRAIEIIGGAGYTEEYVTARLLRDAQVLTVWEGPANIQAHELLRLVAGGYRGFEAFAARVDSILAMAEGDAGDLAATVKAALGACRDAVASVRKTPAEGARLGRRILHFMADTLAAALLIEEASSDIGQGDARKLLITRLFIDQHLALPRSHRVAAPDIWPRQHFRQIVGYEPIEPKDVRAA